MNIAAIHAERPSLSSPSARSQPAGGFEQLEQVCQPTVSNKAIDQHKAYCSDHNDDQDANQNSNRRH
jgi:hypothetical protein